MEISRRKLIGAASAVLLGSDALAAASGPVEGGTGGTMPVPSVPPQGLLLPFAGEENYELGRKLVEDTEGALRRLNRTAESLACPPEAHAALARGEAVAAEASLLVAAASTPLDAIPAVRELVSRHFGTDHEVAVIPFGLKFRERMNFDADITATGTATITFADGDGDVDG